MSSQHFEFSSTPLSGLSVIQRKPILDDRGFFCRLYCDEEFVKAGLVKPIVQINHTFSQKKGTLRGLHFQYPPEAETKIISCIKGEIFDIAVDIRNGSPTLLCWHAEILSAANRKSLFIPEGFAHGFQTLTDDCELIYLHTTRYAPDLEGGLNVRDPRIHIELPLEISEISDKDFAYPCIDDQFEGIII